MNENRRKYSRSKPNQPFNLYLVTFSLLLSVNLFFAKNSIITSVRFLILHARCMYVQASRHTYIVVIGRSTWSIMEAMLPHRLLLLLFLLPTTCCLAHAPPAAPTFDSRWIPNGHILRDGGYSCQPYCAVLPDGTWSCVMTFIHAPVWVEGQPGEHMVSMRKRPR